MDLSLRLRSCSEEKETVSAAPSQSRNSSADNKSIGVSDTSRDRVAKWRQRQSERPGYDHDKIKEQTRLRVASISSKQEKCQ